MCSRLCACFIATLLAHLLVLPSSGGLSTLACIYVHVYKLPVCIIRTVAFLQGGRTRSRAHDLRAVAVNTNIWTTFWHCSLVSKVNIPQFLVQSYRTPSRAFIVS